MDAFLIIKFLREMSLGLLYIVAGIFLAAMFPLAFILKVVTEIFNPNRG